jgi:hypothetical protein
MPKSVPRKTHSKNVAALQTQKPSVTKPLTHVNSPKTGKLITIESAVRQGFMRKDIRDGLILEWTGRALPQETQREVWERSESIRLNKFLLKHVDPAGGRPWPIPDLPVVIKSDNGRFRLYLEIREGMSKNQVRKNYDFLSNWKSRLVEEEGPDPLPHPIDMIVAQHRGSNGLPAMGPSEIARSINRWIVDSLYYWEKASSQSRRFVTRDLLAVLNLFDFTESKAIEILDRAQDDIRRGKKPFQRTMEHRNTSSRAPYPVTAEIVKSKLRTWAGS